MTNQRIGQNAVTCDRLNTCDKNPSSTSRNRRANGSTQTFFEKQSARKRMDIRLAGLSKRIKRCYMALLQKSAKPTNDSSPPIHRWDPSALIQRVREADG